MLTQSGTGLPHSKTLSRFLSLQSIREVLECGSPMPLSTETVQSLALFENLDG
jgi:hypothetical protein